MVIVVVVVVVIVVVVVQSYCCRCYSGYLSSVFLEKVRPKVSVKGYALIIYSIVHITLLYYTSVHKIRCI